MAENYKKSYRKSMYSSSRKGLENDSARREQKRNRPKCTDSRTPPLPAMEDYSIEELLKKREFICEHLEQIKKHANTKQEILHKSSEKKRRYSTKDNKANKIMQTKIQSNVYKEISDKQEHQLNSESEDEEYIIELRRKQRKQLLDQLTGSQDKMFQNEVSTVAQKNTNICNIKNIYTNNQIKHNFEKETTDMFSEKDDFAKANLPENVTQDNNPDNSVLADNWDDEDGYYKVCLGDCINNKRYTIKSILGQGVFANVVRAQDLNIHNQDVAIKIIRNNEFMQKTGLKEVAILKEINENDPDNKYHCIKLLRHFIHKGHLCLVLEPFYMDMRSLLKKYGHHGINLKALMNYTRQLLLALKLLMKIGVIHADIKPDNILVNEKKNVLKLCDFGSAAKIQENEPTPYLVSRYYRAPEIILGIPYSYGVDTWSAACTIYEMATSTILFTGRSNNKMLKCFMDLKGKIPNKLLRKGKFKDQHFNYKNNFLLHKKDKATEREKVVEITDINICRDLHHDLKKYFKKLSSSEEKKVLQLKDLLDKMLMFDEKQRLSVTNCLKHYFLQIPL